MGTDQPPPEITTEEVIAELIRLRELDAQDQARVEGELRQEIAGLWLRVNQARRATPWIFRIFN